MSTSSAGPVAPSAASLPIHSRWTLPVPSQTEVAELARSLELPRALAALLYARGLREPERVRRFLAPAMDQLHDPYTMQGMQAAVHRIQDAIRTGESILIYGDYDVDGTTAIVLLKTAIERLGGKVRFHIPHRLRDGYGMQAEVLSQAASTGVRLVISVDTGIRAFAAGEEARRLGLDLIVTDHHLPDSERPLPHALAVLNPNQAGCGYPGKDLCGAGVAFKLSQALLEAHDRERAREKLLPSFLKMLAIATIADAVPLQDENRVIAHLGIAQLQRLNNPGLRALFEVAQVDTRGGRLTATDIAFRVAPRINAAGRMDVASDVVELFTTRDEQRARTLAEKLHRLNGDRRDTESAILAEIEDRLRADAALAQSLCIVMDGEGWHRGILGILASRIVDRTHRPALVIAHEAGHAHGSGRSIPDFHLLQALESCHDLFSRFGGHAHAVGFSLPSGRLPELRERLHTHAASTITAEMLQRELRCDALLPLNEITPAFYRALRQLEPFGMGNPEPVFVAPAVHIVAPPQLVKEKHLRLRVAQGPGQPAFSALAWRWAAWLPTFELGPNASFDIAYRLRLNEHPDFGGLELELVDLRPAGALAPNAEADAYASASVPS